MDGCVEVDGAVKRNAMLATGEARDWSEELEDCETELEEEEEEYEEEGEGEDGEEGFASVKNAFDIDSGSEVEGPVEASKQEAKTWNGLDVKLNARIISGSGILQNQFALEQQKMLFSGQSWESSFETLKHFDIAVVHPGRDKKNRRIVFLLAVNLLKAFNKDEKNFDQTLLYTLFILQALSHETFVVVHVHDGLKELNSKYLKWLSKLYKLLPSANLRSIGKVYVLTSSKKLRSRMWIARPFTSSKLWKRIEYVHSRARLKEKLQVDLSVLDMTTDHDTEDDELEEEAGKEKYFSLSSRFKRSAKLDRSSMSHRALGATIAEEDGKVQAKALFPASMDMTSFDDEEDYASFRTFAADSSGNYDSEREDGSFHEMDSVKSKLGFLSRGKGKSQSLSPLGDAQSPTTLDECSSKDLSSLSPTSTSESFRVGKVFGCPLLCSCEDGALIPPVVLDCVHFLAKYGQNEEGLFRIPGDDLEVTGLKSAYDAGSRPLLDSVSATEEQHLSASQDSCGIGEEKPTTSSTAHRPCTSPPKGAPSVNAVGSLLKAYFRELPSPIVPPDSYSVVIQLSEKISDQTTLAYQLGDTMMGMPQHNFNTLGFLVHFLAHLAKNRADVTKMNTQNITIVWAPNILSRGRRQQQTGSIAALQHFAELPHVVKAINCMISHPDIVFPTELLSQTPDSLAIS